MIFSDLSFLLFFVVITPVYWSARGMWRKIILLVGSYTFYAFWDYRFILLLFSLSAVAYVGGLLMGLTQELRRRKALIWLFTFVVLSVLAYFKYTNFFVESVSEALSWFGLSISVDRYSIILPLGISFISFHAISYLVDVYRAEVKPDRYFIDVSIYIAFFPCLVAGPIVRAKEFLPQLERETQLTSAMLERGVSCFALGLLYKMGIADRFAQIVDPVFTTLHDWDRYSIFAANVAYYGQIYFDFLGYSSMGIGVASVLGYHLSNNFEAPYSSLSVTEFWRRWHISLSSWLRDYIYIPLGGNRVSPRRQYANIFITMLLGGLWHGASYNFLVWGAIHGGALCLHKAWLGYGKPLLGNTFSNIPKIFRILCALFLTQTIVFFAWIFFRAQNFNDALYVMKVILGADTSLGQKGINLSIWLLLLPLVVDGLMTRFVRDRGRQLRLSSSLSGLAFGMIMATVLLTAALANKPFIYFQF